MLAVGLGDQESLNEAPSAVALKTRAKTATARSSHDDCVKIWKMLITAKASSRAYASLL